MSFWDRKINPNHYEIEIDRDNLLQDALSKVVHLQKIENYDRLKLPLKIWFKNEPGIDVGGLTKEFLALITQELFTQEKSTMFKYNEDVEMYWFNGATCEPLEKFELAGSIMALAIYNHHFVDMPLAPTIFKILLSQNVSLQDMHQWQPETAKSLQYILDYPSESEVKLEDIICRNFTIDVQVQLESGLMSTKEIELCDGGSGIEVTIENRENFVSLYVQFSFKTQCSEQLQSFINGFDRICSRQLLAQVLSPEDLQQLVQGQLKLNFADLEQVCRYGNGYSPDHRVIKWFWQIVLEEYTDDQRRRLLVFSTGTDRAPVNGLKSMKFAIVKDTELAGEGGKLPTSHTCFN